ncbi:diguanylate cyclase domain-containing protein [Xylophilus sp. GOD-11R]|uniref:diguanylate cyclase domain-containing protein n=1 Tax=Xylophilus sp. GOD-11R TaxID=3089814 RepID=UPI00298CB746|nr:diguanylate cyclase [Xylophilus sp. GOD-11R]WPB55062.1 diguanylate cyclase [Xylophilus sp. GOD-11R]
MFSSPRRTFALLALVPIISIAALFGMLVLDGRQDLTRNMRQSNANLANTVEENIRRVLDFYDRSILGVLEEVAKPEVMALPSDIRQRVIFDKAVSVNGVSTMLVADANGQVVMTSSQAPGASAIAIADRPYFIHHRDNLDPGLYISEPIISRLDNQAVIVLSRRISLPDRSFGGVVVLQLKIRSLDELFNAVNLGDGGRITLLREDGVVLSRFPADKETAGQSLATSPILARFKAGENNFEAKSVVDGVDRFYVFKAFDRYPLIITVAQATELPYAGWRQRTFGEGLITLTLMIGCTALAWLFLRELEARQQTAYRLRNAERDLRTILDGLPSMVAYWDKHLLIRFANSLYMKTLGADTTDNGEPVGGLIEGQRLVGINAPYFERALAGERQEFETPLTDGEGRRRYLLVSFVPDVEDGVVQGVFVQATDISDRKAAESRLLEEKERIRVTLASIGDAVVSTDSEGRVTYLNPVAEIMSGYTPEEAIGREVGEVFPLHDGDSPEPVRNPVAQALAEQRIVTPSQSASLVNRRQLRFDIEDTAAPIHDRDGRTLGAVMVLRDVTAARAMVLRLAHLAQYDALTSLPNRVLLFDRAQQAVARARREKTTLALMYLDLDGFKDINDSLGHDAGDAVLVQFSARMSAALRSSDTLSRQGGDEFVVLAPMVADVGGAEILATKLVELAAEPFLVGEHALRVTTSLGIALFPQDGDTFDLLARHADAAMYSAKRAGKNQYCFYSPDIARHTEQRFAEHRHDR